MGEATPSPGTPGRLYKQTLNGRNRTLNGSTGFLLKGQEGTVVGRLGAGCGSATIDQIRPSQSLPQSALRRYIPVLISVW